jgi:hypothetical protein
MFFGSERAVSVSVAMGIIIATGWAGGYLMVRSVSSPFFPTRRITRAQGTPIAGYVYLLNAYGGAESMYAEYSVYRPAPAMFYAGSMGMGWMRATGLVSLMQLRTFFQKGNLNQRA